MLQLLIDRFVMTREEKERRGAYGTLCSILGIVLNLILFAGKLLAGALSGSIAITADAFNNLSDAGSSLISLLGFRLAAKKPNPEHPFGHGRFEYLSGLAVAVLILIMAVELGQSSVEKILHPEEAVWSVIAIVILAVSVLVKFYMYSYNHRIGKQIEAEALLATAKDSLSDCCATAAVLAATLVEHFLHVPINGWCGLAVAVLILFAGIGAVKETVGPLLGEAPTKEFVDSIAAIVRSYENVSGIHDLIVHDYGPGRKMISLHAEVPGNINVFVLHDMIDCIEKELQEKLGCHATIHMDPVETDSAAVKEMRARVAKLAASVDSRLSIHDFRMVTGKTHTNVIFDLVVPYECEEEMSVYKERVASAVRSMEGNLIAVIEAERSYV